MQVNSAVKRVKILVLIMLCFCNLASAMNWEWIESDDKFGKYIAPDTIQVNRNGTGGLDNIEVWCKTAYTYKGAENILSQDNGSSAKGVTPGNLSYSLMKLKIYPESGKLERQREVFYKSDGSLLWTNEKPYVAYVYYKTYYEPYFYFTIDKIAKDNEYARYKNEDHMLAVGSDKWTCGIDTMSIRENGSNISFYIWYIGDKSISIVHEFIQSDNLADKTGIVFIYDKIKDKTFEIPNPELTSKELVPDSVGYQIRQMILEYCQNNQAWIHRYDHGVYVSANGENTQAHIPVGPVYNKNNSEKQKKYF
jgi:hypothetical protein